MKNLFLVLIILLPMSIFNSCYEDSNEVDNPKIQNLKIQEFASKFTNKIANLKIDKDFSSLSNNQLMINENSSIQEVFNYLSANTGISGKDWNDISLLVYDYKDFIEGNEEEVINSIIAESVEMSQNQWGISSLLGALGYDDCGSRIVGNVLDLGLSAGATIATAPTGVGAVAAGANLVGTAAALASAINDCRPTA